MARTLFRRASPGERLVRGELVKCAQVALADADHSPGMVDGIFGGDTEKAVKRWQSARQQPETGEIDFDGWSLLTQEPVPSLRDRCLQLTADFEQHGFGRIAGNFDGAWLTWGIIGFTLKHGEMQRIINEVRLKFPQLIREAFGPLEDELADVFDGSRELQRAFADRISLGRQRYKVLPDWAQAFETLGSFSEVQEVQQRGVDKYWQIAVRDVDRFELKSELGFSMCFDIAVQNGGIDFRFEENSIRRRIAQFPPANRLEKRLLVADVIAENSNRKYIEDVRSRKRTIASGEGIVHGAKYKLTNWALIDEIDG